MSAKAGKIAKKAAKTGVWAITDIVFLILKMMGTVLLIAVTTVVLTAEVAQTFSEAQLAVRIILPGDVVIARLSGVIFIPPHLVVELILSVEVAALRNNFNLQRREGKIDNNTDFNEWLKQQSNLPMPKAELDAYLNQQVNQPRNQQPNRSQRQ